MPLFVLYLFFLLLLSLFFFFFFFLSHFRQDNHAMFLTKLPKNIRPSKSFVPKRNISISSGIVLSNKIASPSLFSKTSLKVVDPKNTCTVSSAPVLSSKRFFATEEKSKENAQNVLHPEDVDVNLITLGEVKKNALGAKFANIHYPGTRKIRIQTPTMRTPFGITTSPDNASKYRLSLSFDSISSNKEMETFYNKVQEIDAKIKSLILENSATFLGSEGKKAEEKLSKFHLSLKQQEEYPPLISTNITVNENKAVVPIYLDESTRGTFDDVSKGSTVQAIFSLKNVYVIGPNIGYTWSADQILVVEKGKSYSPHDFAFKSKK
eukprot:TRINITY_DN1057_c0_g1_i1.p1 TRINITY_DN1057_c0_g1~~TRINITY_DN1057_c0_g1_i1.p1  ORF type:complete len:322 (+),score=71.26 TRINITY_DN1057_c0_g1_i1:53-1018(+)